MRVFDTLPEHRKAKRRRLNKPAACARLFLEKSAADEDVGVLSEDLYSELCEWCEERQHNSGARDNTVHFVAISPWTSSSHQRVQSTDWTIVPVKKARVDNSNNQKLYSSLQIPHGSLSVQSFFAQLGSASAERAFAESNLPIEIRIWDVLPSILDTVYIEVYNGKLHRPGQKQVEPELNGITSPSDDNGAGDNDWRKQTEHAFQENHWRDAVRKSFKEPTLVHTGDFIEIQGAAEHCDRSVPSRGKIRLSEPVSQGLIYPSTNIVIIPSLARLPWSRWSRWLPLQPAHLAVNNPGYGEGAGEQNAAELLSWQGTPSEDSDSLGDSTDFISLHAPKLSPHKADMLSTSVLTDIHNQGLLANGEISLDPHYSTLTDLAAPVSDGMVLRTRGLLQRIPDDITHPRPRSEEDDEARVFVDTNSLISLGCFSGDWVGIQAAEEARLNSLGSWGIGASCPARIFEPKDWRAVKVFALPITFSEETPGSGTGDGSSNAASPRIHSPTALRTLFASPILLANMGGPTQVQIWPIPTSSSVNTANYSMPKTVNRQDAVVIPVAKEVNLLKIATPLSSERVLQPSLFAGLKEYFELKRRILKTGDLIAIPVDEDLGRATFQEATADDEDGPEELLSTFPSGESGDIANSHRPGKTAVAWFKVDSVSCPSVEQVGHSVAEKGLSGIAYVDAARTSIRQAGTVQSRIPPAVQNGWQYYLGITKLPRYGRHNNRDSPNMHVSHTRRRLRELVSATTSPWSVHHGLQPLAILLASAQRQIGKAMTASQACADLGIHVFSINAYDILSEGGQGANVTTEGYLRSRAERGLACGAENTALLIRHIEALNADRMTAALKEIIADSRVVIATTTDIDKLSEGLRGLFTHELEMTAPDEAEREALLRSILDDAGFSVASDVALSAVAVKTAALVAGDLRDVVDRAIVARQERLEKLAVSASAKSPVNPSITVRDIQLAGGDSVENLTKADFDVAVEAARKNFSDAIGAPKIPNVTWDDVGGLANVKEAVLETIQLPLERPELFAKGMKKRSGILFYGPPGTGKTLLAKAIATEFSLNFFSVKGPELLNMYIGESEANVRRVFQKARDARPCVVFFDELDSVAPKRGNQGDSGGVMDRIVSQLLAELDGMSSGEEGGPGGGGGGVFVIGATNRPDLLDQALLRPGRFDKMLYLGVSDTHEKQRTILQALTRKFTLDPSLSLSRVTSSLPFTYTGADLYALCSDAMLKAITRRASAVDAEIKQLNAQRQESDRVITEAYFFDHLATPEDVAVVVMEEDFMAAKAELVPSVSAKELQHYERVRRTFEQAGEGNGPAEEVKGGLSNGVRSYAARSSGQFRAKGKGTDPPPTNVDGIHHAEWNGEESARPVEKTHDDDEFIIRTDQLSLKDEIHAPVNGHASGAELANGNGKAMTRKGKGKQMDTGHDTAFADPAARDDEELYG